VYFEVMFWYLFIGTVENRKNHQDGGFPPRDLKPVSPKFRAGRNLYLTVLGIPVG
jgi:hypothetical protein